MSGSIGLVLNVMIIGLLGATIGFAAVLNRRLSTWRREKAEFERLIAEFNRAAGRAEAGVERLKSGSEETGRALQQATTKGRALCDDLGYLIERAEPLADRLTDLVRAARHQTNRSESPWPAAAESPSRQPETPVKVEPADDGDDRSRAKRELLRALSAMR
jgi:hypothetical protein